MTGWEIKDIIKSQEEAHAGNSVEIDRFVSGYPLCYVSPDYSLLLILRKFKVQLWNDVRSVLNCKPEGGSGEQWGVTISRCDFEDGSGSSMSVCIPDFSYTGITCNEKDEIIIMSDRGITRTNRIELLRKLKWIYGKYPEQEILEAFNTLCNGQYEQAPLPGMAGATVESTVIGIMQYDEKMKRYSGTAMISGEPVPVYLSSADIQTMKTMLKHMDMHMGNKFYEKALQQMYPSMVKLKNDVWLGEDEDGKEEPPITAEEFAGRVSITSVSFDEDGPASIYCDDDDIFWGHCIIISTDKNGLFKEAHLAG